MVRHDFHMGIAYVFRKLVLAPYMIVKHPQGININLDLPPNPHELRSTIYKTPIKINYWAEPTWIRWGAGQDLC